MSNSTDISPSVRSPQDWALEGHPDSCPSRFGRGAEERGGVGSGRSYRWIVEAAPVDPVLNMARDAALLDEMIAGTGLPAVRVYQWSTPAVTVGRLQNEDDVRAAFPGLALVRRPTGGRAVIHGDDLTVSVATRDEWLPVGTGGAVMSSYQVIVTGIVEALRRHGVDAHLGRRPSRCGAGVPAREPNKAAGSVDCFASTASCDIADASTGVKIVGSAQRRERGAILQQMSIHGDIIRRVGPLDAFVDDLRECLEASLGVNRWKTPESVFIDTDSSAMIY